MARKDLWRSVGGRPTTKQPLFYGAACSQLPTCGTSEEVVVCKDDHIFRIMDLKIFMTAFKKSSLVSSCGSSWIKKQETVLNCFLSR